MKRRRTLLVTEVDTGYKNQYFTIVSEADNNAIGWKTGYANSARTISISTDEGKTWTTATSTTSGVTLATLNTDDILLIKGSNTEYFDEGGSWNSPRANMFTSSGKFHVEGNIMSLIYGDDFKDQVTLTTANSFRYMFYNCSKLTTAENCIMPATTLTSSCYDRMFSNCTILTKAPTLPAPTLVTGCYSYMFNGSRALNYIRCLAVNHSASNCTNNWVQNVASSGTFLKNKNASWSRGNSAVPTNWTLDDYGCGIEWSASTFTTYMNNTSNKPTFSNPNNLPVTFSSSDTSVATVNSKGVVSIVGAGTTTLIAYFAGNEEYDEESVACVLTVKKVTANISWEQASYTFDPDSPLRPVFNNPNNLQISFSSSNTTVATISGTTTPSIVYKKDGTTTLTAYFAGNNIYESSSVTCQLTLYTDYSAKCLVIKSEAASNVIKWTHIGTTAKTIYVSSNGGSTWEEKTSTTDGTTLATLASGKKLLIKGNLQSTYNTDSDYCYFGSSGNYSIQGNIMSLLYGDDFVGQQSLANHNYAFCNLFKDSTLLTSAANLVLPATTLSEGCYYEMFRGCSNLQSSPSMLAESLADSCYYGMFYGTKTLPDVSSIDFTSTSIVSSGGLKGLFAGTIVTDDNLAQMLPLYNGNNYMLPAMSLSQECYYAMFADCTKLTTAPALPSTTLAIGCYQNMFSGCTVLVNAPKLSASTLKQDCYREMFSGCSKLHYIYCSASNISASGCTESWLLNVSTSGLFEKLSWFNGWSRGASGIPTDWTVGTFYDEYLTIVSLENNNYVYLKNTNSNYVYYGKYSYDKITWTRFYASGGTESVGGRLNTGDKLYIKASNNSYFYGDYNNFSVAKKFYVEGNLASLTYNNKLTSFGSNQASGVFKNCTTLISAENLNISVSSSSASGCVNNLFYGCTSLIKPPKLGSKYLPSSVYFRMFKGCTSLTTAPALPATTLGSSCYSEMFAGCTSLTTVPATLPATTLESSCYRHMFERCMSLTTAPELPVTTLTSSCYEGMFECCTSLREVPNLPATTLSTNCYYRMFKDCWSLTSIPNNLLPVTTLASNCYNGMFQGCFNLVSVPSNLLPATTLTSGCYEYMFQNCTSLTTAPVLPATTLVDSCYYQMFYGCTSLNYVKCLPTSGMGSYNTKDWLFDVASAGTFVKASGATWPTGDSGIPSNWNVQNV